MTSLIIPTRKQEAECKPLIAEITNTATNVGEIICTGLDASAAINRNNGLDRAKYGIIIMVDDDMTGFYRGWDEDLTAPLSNKGNKIVSARLKCEDGSWMDTIGDVRNYSLPLIDAKNNIIPSCCIAFRSTPVRFNEEYKGAGFEDTSYCLRMTKTGGKVCINNRCVLVHKNEKKHGDFFAHNRKVFMKEFGLTHEECYKYH